MASTNAYRRFWSLVWPHLEAGAWQYDLQPGPQAAEASADQSDVGTAAAAKGLASDLHGDGGVASSRGCDSCCGSTSPGNRSVGDIPEEIDRSSSRGIRDRSSRGVCSRRRKDAVPLPIFFPPAVGVASEGLELALHHDPPPDGEATSGDRIERLEGIDAVVELLQRVPGYPDTSGAGSVPSMDAVAAVARAVLVPPAARREEVGSRIAVGVRAKFGVMYYCWYQPGRMHAADREMHPTQLIPLFTLNLDTTVGHLHLLEMILVSSSLYINYTVF